LIAVPAEKIETTPRARSLGRLRDYYERKQYKDRPDFWTGKRADGSVAPVRERAPCVVYALPKAIVQQAVRFTFGEGRFPRINVEPIKPDQAPGPGLALSEDEAGAIEQLLAELVDQMRLRSGMRTALRGGLIVGSGVTILSVRKGRFRAEYPRAEHCWPTFVPEGDGEVESLVWCYRFNKLVTDDRGELVERPHFFRRDVTATEYVVYQDALIESGKPVRWVRDEEQSRVHGLGFCPVVWTRNLCEEFSGSVDGEAIYNDFFDEFDALNLAYSQRHRGINYWGSPQPWETGVKGDDGPAAAARTAGTQRKRKDDGGFSAPTSGGDAARAIAVDEVWQYENPEAQVGLLETTGKAFESATKHVDDIKGRILEATSVVLHDAAAVNEKGELSGKALALLFAPLLALVDELRDCWWPHGLRAVLQMALRMVAVLAVTATIFLPRVGEVARILQRFMVQAEGEKVWCPPPLTPIWGRFFSPSEAEVKASVDAAVAAQDGGLIAPKTAASYVADDFGVRDVEAELEEAEKHGLEAAQEQLEAAKKAMGTGGAQGDAGGPPGGDPGAVAGDEDAPAA
jgi:hypothetical protein